MILQKIFYTCSKKKNKINKNKIYLNIKKNLNQLLIKSENKMKKNLKEQNHNEFL